MKSEAWKSVYDELDHRELAVVREVLWAELLTAPDPLKRFLSQRLNYVEERLKVMGEFLPRCGECVYFRPYSEYGDAGWCIIHGESLDECSRVNRNLLSLCVDFRRKSRRSSQSSKQKI